MSFRDMNSSEEPLDSEVEALRLLADYSYRHSAWLDLKNRQRGLKHVFPLPRIVVEIAGGAYGLEVVGERRYYLTERCAQALIDCGYVDVREFCADRLGGTERLISDFGRNTNHRNGVGIGAAMDALSEFIRVKVLYADGGRRISFDKTFDPEVFAKELLR